MRRILFIILFFVLKLGFAQVKTIGTPNIKNYPRLVYKAGTQNWGIAQDHNGFMYFANNEGVLRFDGVGWSLIKVDKSSIVRSVYVDSKNRIFVGLLNDLGIIDENEEGKYVYKSLRYLLPPECDYFSDVWRIHEVKQGIVFQSFEHVFILKDGEFEVVNPKKRFRFSFNVNGRLFMQEPGVGLFEYITSTIDKVPWANILIDKDIWSIQETGENQLLIGTEGDGFYKYDHGLLRKWDTPVSEFVKKNKLYSATQIGNNYFAFGTILNGVVICDKDGNIIQHINRDKGLANNTILSVFSDKDENLWLGLDNGIDYVEVNSPMSFFTTNEGIGTGYCCRVFKGKLYLGTNQGLFVKPFNTTSQHDEAFELVKNSAGQVWTLNEFDGQLVCGHNLGTFIVENNVARQISDVPGAWKFISPKNHPEILIGGHYLGLFLLKKGRNGWEFFKNVKGFLVSSRFLFESKNGDFWISHGGKGVFKVQLNEKLDSVTNTTMYGAKEGLPSDENNILLNINEDWYITGGDGLYSYRQTDDSFVKNDEVTEMFGESGQVKYVETDAADNVWFIAENETGLIRRNEDFTFSKITLPFQQLINRFVNWYEFLYPYSSDHVFIGLENGFVHYSAKIHKSYSNSFSAFITKVELPYLDSVVNVSTKNKKAYRFPFERNSFRFYYSAPFFENPTPLLFSYYIEGYSTHWSDWSTDSYRDFTNLSEDDYVFQVKAKNVYNVESEIATFKFSIAPPWYRADIAYYLYFFLLIIVAFIFTFIVQRRIKKSKQKEKQQHEIELQKREEQFHQQALQTEKEIMKLRNEKLQSEKLSLDKELANQTMSIIQRNKFLMKLAHELKRIQDATDDSSLKTKMVILKKRIDKEIDSEQQNKIFESYFDEVHADFFKRIKQDYPQLSPKDLRLCAFIRMNISTKEIATLLNISDRGVEISRYRLRKKMEISRDINLSTFLSNI